mgnify:CR=1 FL=1
MEDPLALCTARYTECFINEKFPIGFVDSRADKTLVCRTYVDQLKLEITEKRQLITSYGNVSNSTTTGTMDINLN